MTVKVSIIIPVYNVENYLEKCLDSVISQTLDNIEIICVNDGSTDKSLKILNNYASSNSNIRIINKKNGGLGNARNVGISHANGEYIGFIDSDDWISKDMFEKLYNNAKKLNSDMVMCPINVVDENSNTTRYDISYFTLECFDKSFDNITFTHFDVKDFIFKIPVTAWNKIYKNSFLKDIGALFPEGLIFEDNPFFYKVILNSNRISLIRDYLYYYRYNRKDSILDNKKDKYFDVLKIHEYSIKVFKDAELYNFYKISLLSYITNSCLNRYKMVDEDLKQDFFELIKKFTFTFDLTEGELLEISKISNLKNIQNSKYYTEYELKNEFDKKIKEVNRENIEIKKKYSKNLKLLKKERKKVKNLQSYTGCIKYKINKFINIFKK